MLANIKSRSIKVGRDLFQSQLIWTVWYLAIMLTIQFGVYFFIDEATMTGVNLFDSIFQSSMIYLLIIGIITGRYFIIHFLKVGVTRREYFNGSAIAMVMLSFTIMIIAALLTALTISTGIASDFSGYNNVVEFLNTNSFWIIPIFSLSFILITYYLAGWIISLSFYRYSAFKAAFSIVFAIFYIGVLDIIWQGNLVNPFAFIFNVYILELSLTASITASLIIIAAGLLIVYNLIKDIPIKIG